MTRVAVTAEHIRLGVTPATAGKIGSPTSLARRCPLALALRGAFPGAREVVVAIRRAVVDGRIYALPEAAQAIVAANTDGRRPRPVTFELPGPVAPPG